MADGFQISLALLEEGEEVITEETISCDFLDVQEEELRFEDTVSVHTIASLVDQHILLKISAKCTALLPCSICNEWTDYPISIENFSVTEELPEKIKFFDYTNILREVLLLELPQFVECNGGSCPERKNMECYCTKSSDEKKIAEYFPFEQLK
jgi:hypothetical protein